MYTAGLRSYNPRLGRWINRDPIGEKGGENVYGFIKNSSIASIDFNGLTVVPIVVTPIARTPRPASRSSSPSPFGRWHGEARIDRSEGKKLLCVLNLLGFDEGAIFARTYFALETLIEQDKAWTGTRKSANIYGQALGGQIIVRNNLGLANRLATLMHETVHIISTNGIFEDYIADSAGAMEDAVLDSIAAANRPITQESVCCRRRNDSTFRTTWTKYDRIQKTCGFPDVCERLGATLVSSATAPGNP